MATTKGSENELNAKRTEKPSEGSTAGRRTQKSKVPDHAEGSQKKQTRAKSRIAVSDDPGQSQGFVSKAREKGKLSSDALKEDGSAIIKKETDIPKREMEVGEPSKKDVIVLPKKDSGVIGSLRKDVLGCGQLKKDEESAGLPKKDGLPITASKKDIEVGLVKSRKVKVKTSGNIVGEKKRDERLNPQKIEEIKSEVTTSEKLKSKDDKQKSDRKENGMSSNEKIREIMSADITSSAEIKPVTKVTRKYTSALLGKTKETGWSPGDLAWGRVGQHPFWPCMIAVDQVSGIFTKTRRVGRSVNAVQHRLHVQFFGDNGRHSWIPTSSVIKYEGKDSFELFADRVLLEIKKKDKKYSSAFIVKPSCKDKWEVAIHEAEESVPKTREDRIQFFQELLPKRRKTAAKNGVQKNRTRRNGAHKNGARKNVAQKNDVEKDAENSARQDDAQINDSGKTKSNVQLVKKRNKRPNPSTDDEMSKSLPSKQIKVERGQVLKTEEKSTFLTIKQVRVERGQVIKTDEGIKFENVTPSTSTRKRRGRDKTVKKEIGNAGK